MTVEAVRRSTRAPRPFLSQFELFRLTLIKWFSPEFFQIRHIGMTKYFYKWFHRFFDPENIGVDTRIMILCPLKLEILSKLDFHGGYFEKWPY